MELDRISAVVRPRSHWEAVDLGIVMARAWWWPLSRAWLAVTLPAFALLQLAAFAYPWAPILLFWWFKPLWERSLLHILSRALFGELPSLRETLRVFPRLAAKQWFASLTYRRFSPSRAMDLPVLQLEGLKGRQRSQRLQLLHGRHGTGAGWLTFVGIHIEAILPLACVTLFYMLVPNEIELDGFARHVSESGMAELLLGLLGYSVMSLVAPFYVAAGFSLYLNRRTWLEGWDIELLFRRLLERLQGNGLARVAALLFAFTVVLLQYDPVMAATGVKDRIQAKAEIEEIMAGEAFHEKATIRHLDWGNSEKTSSLDLPSWLLNLIEFLAANLRAILWAAVIALALLFIFKYRHWLAQQAWRLQQASKDEEPMPSMLFGMEVSAETLPEDIPGQVSALWQQRHYRAAYALLYRAALSRLMAHYQVRFRSGHTEDECTRLVQTKTGPVLGDYFAELTLHWQCLAYAHQVPADAVITSLCQRWPQHFEKVQPGG